MGISDIVAQTIIQMMEESGGQTDIRRNELASLIGCVPSQINYVLMSRFTPEQGYIVESRRGGGGFIRITRVKMDRSTAIMHTVNSVGNSISQASCAAILNNLCNQEFISRDMLKIMLAATSDKSFRDVPVQLRDTVRSGILKNMLINAL